MKILITGGAGFIGSAVIRHLIHNTNCAVVNLDALTYAGNLESLREIEHSDRYVFERANICDRDALEKIFNDHKPDSVMHLAAESHVDRSIQGPAEFIQTNIVGTYNLLQVARNYWSHLSSSKQDQFRFHHISTDEVYGDLENSDEYFVETTAYAPSSPYSASKASSDHLVRAWQRTFGLPCLITNCSNNYGPYQFPEKLVPLIILNALNRKPLPVYGDGTQIRDWLFVDDHARALCMVLEKGQVGETYNIGGDSERQNINVVRAICDVLADVTAGSRDDYYSLIKFVADRPGHDLRYAIDASKIRKQLGWVPEETFESGLEKTVRWYLDNSDWVSHVQSGEYRKWLEKNYSNRESGE